MTTSSFSRAGAHNVLLRRHLRSSRGRISQIWYEALTRSDDCASDRDELYRRLPELFDQIIVACLSEPFNPVFAQAIGATLAGLCRSQPESLGVTQAVLAQELIADVLLLDLRMPGPGPTITVAELRAACPALKVLVLSAHDGDAYVRAMLAAGVAGYVCKDEDTDAIVAAIRTVASGGAWFSRTIADKLAQWGAGKQPGAARLSARQHAALRLIVAGKTNREIGQSLGLGEKAIERLVSEICAKLSVRSRVSAAVHAVREGLVV